MAVKLRLTRVGSKKNPVYRVVAADSRSPRDGKFIEIVGRYNPQTDPSTIELDEEKVKDWLAKGAQPSSTVQRLLKAKGVGVAEIVEYLARRLVDEPDAVRVEEVEREGALVLQLHVAQDDVGKVIGRQGRIARALRTIVRASAAQRDQRVAARDRRVARPLARRGALRRPRQPARARGGAGRGRARGRRRDRVRRRHRGRAAAAARDARARALAAERALRPRQRRPARRPEYQDDAGLAWLWSSSTPSTRTGSPACRSPSVLDDTLYVHATPRNDEDDRHAS